MDGLFRTVTAVDGFDGQRLAVRIAHPAEREFFAGVAAPRFATDVQLVDAMFQTGGMLEVLTSGDIVLPYRIRRMNWYGAAPRRGPRLPLPDRADRQRGKDGHLSADPGRRGRTGPWWRSMGFEMVKVDRLRPEDRIDERLVGDLRKAS